METATVSSAIRMTGFIDDTLAKVEAQPDFLAQLERLRRRVAQARELVGLARALLRDVTRDLEWTMQDSAQ